MNHRGDSKKKYLLIVTTSFEFVLNYIYLMAFTPLNQLLHDFRSIIENSKQVQIVQKVYHEKPTFSKEIS